MTPSEIERHIEMILQKQARSDAEIRNLRISVVELAIADTKLSELSDECFARLDEARSRSRQARTAMHR